jgi:hypothetical protein
MGMIDHVFEHRAVNARKKFLLPSVSYRKKNAFDTHPYARANACVPCCAQHVGHTYKQICGGGGAGTKAQDGV